MALIAAAAELESGAAVTVVVDTGVVRSSTVTVVVLVVKRYVYVLREESVLPFEDIAKWLHAPCRCEIDGHSIVRVVHVVGAKVRAETAHEVKVFIFNTR